MVTPWHLKFSRLLGEAEVPFRVSKWFLLNPGSVRIQAELSVLTLRCQLSSLLLPRSMHMEGKQSLDSGSCLREEGGR